MSEPLDVKRLEKVGSFAALLLFMLCVYSFVNLKWFGTVDRGIIQTSYKYSTGGTSGLRQVCSPQPVRRLSASLQADDTGHIMMLPPPKVISRAGDLSEPASVIAYSNTVIVSIDFERQTSEVYESSILFLMNRLCLQSRTFEVGEGTTNVLNGSLVRFISVVEARVVGKEQFLSNIQEIEIPPQYLDEAYIIDVAASTITICVPSVNGLRLALASIAQLMENPTQVEIPLRIVDWPSQHWRGLMLDVARHFMPVRKLYRALDAMHAVKMNRLHLHLTDSQSFPLMLEDAEGLPLSELAGRGAFRPSDVYSLPELRDVVDYANKLGIEVVPEIDVPAHTKSWGQGFDDLVVKCPKAESRGNGASTADIPSLDISNPKVLIVIEQVLKQVASVFTSGYMHVGGDEIHFDCWDESETMIALRTERKSNWVQLLKNFEGEVFNIVRGLGKSPIIWQDLQDSGSVPSNKEYQDLSSTVIVQPWKCWGGLSSTAAVTAAAAGRKVVVSSCMYLDWEIEWDDLFSSDSLKSAILRVKPLPLRTSGTSRRDLSEGVRLDGHLLMFSEARLTSRIKNRKLDIDNSRNSSEHANNSNSPVLGGEVALWSERIDFSNVECRLWPRAVASASVFWGFPMDVSHIPKNASTNLIKLENSFMSTREIKYSNESSKEYYTIMESRLRWLQSYFFLQQFLESVIRIYPAKVIIHRNLSNFCMGHDGKKESGLVPHVFTDSAELFQELSSALSCAKARHLEFGFPPVTSQCQLLPVHLQIPVLSESSPAHGDQVFQHRLRGYDVKRKNDNDVINVDLKVTTYNIENGGFEGNRIDLVQKWLLSRALLGDTMIGLIEINKWQTLRKQDDRKFNLEDIVFRAAEVGFAYSHVTSSTVHPYSIGLVSVLPFSVIAEYGPPNLLRLMLHVYFEMVDLHVIVLHLTPQSSLLRREEARFVQKTLQPLHEAGAKVILMGDLNTLSPSEHCSLYNSQCGVASLGNHSDSFLDVIQASHNAAYKRMREKYCSYSPSNELEIDYLPFNILLNSSFVDTCDLMCRQSLDEEKLENLRDKQYISCILSSCGHSEPTSYNPEWPLAMIGVPAPKLRVDHILINKVLAAHIHSAESFHKYHHGMIYNLTPSVLRGPDTDFLSDHYPVHLEFPLQCSSRFWRRRLEWDDSRAFLY